MSDRHDQYSIAPAARKQPYHAGRERPKGRTVQRIKREMTGADQDFWRYDYSPHYGGGMKRTFAFLIGCAALASVALPANAAGSGLGWKVSSYQSVKVPEVCFYGSANVFRMSGHLNVWTKCLAKEDLDNAVKADSTGSLSDIAADKIAHDYVPPIAGLGHLPGDQIVGTVPEDLVGYLGGDWLKVRRAENLARMVAKMQERLRQRKAETEPP